jgi:hypothetical protein
MGTKENSAPDGADIDVLANQYEFLVLHGLSVPTVLDVTLRDAHRTVHLRGIDPLRKTGR